MKLQGPGILELQKLSATSDRVSTRVNAGGTWRIFACEPCTACKGPSGRSHAPLQQFSVGSLMERVAVDVVGPLPCLDKLLRSLCHRVLTK